MQLPDAVVEKLLREWPVARLATLNPDGAPHQVPIVFARVGDELVTPIDGKPKSGRELARVKHVRRDPRVGLLLDDYAEDWQQLWWLRIDGQARVVTTDREIDPRVRPVAEALRAKYPQYRDVPLFSGPPTFIAIAIESTTSWCATRDPLPLT